MVTAVIGVTGTREQLSAAAIRRLWRTVQTFGFQLDALEITGELHHGDCSGADNVANVMATILQWRRVSHPCTGTAAAWRAHCDVDKEMPAKEPLDRNQDIVNVVDELIALPQLTEERSPRSGTWATIRMARRRGIPITIIYQDGRVVREAPKSESSI